MAATLLLMAVTRVELIGAQAVTRKKSSAWKLHGKHIKKLKLETRIKQTFKFCVVLVLLGKLEDLVHSIPLQ